MQQGREQGMARKAMDGGAKDSETRAPNPVDVHVGGRVRLRRLYLGMSQSALARSLGVTFQQVQKYERGHNRISASRLFDLSRILEVPIGYFFQDIPESVTGAGRAAGPAGEAERTAAEGFGESLAARETMELIRAYYGIPDPNLRRRLYEIFKALALDAEKSRASAASSEQGLLRERSDGSECENGGGPGEGR
jgi:transcriptional regulator with XRE-family HTH domain